MTYTCIYTYTITYTYTVNDSQNNDNDIDVNGISESIKKFIVSDNKPKSEWKDKD